jgi:1,4-alpha-glucan branching enzyme
MAVWDTMKKKGSVRELRVAGTTREVEFKLSAPEARSVHVAGSFNDWDTGALPLKKYRDGIWRTKVNLPIGRHEYKYFIDGAWAQDTPCTEKIPNTFGTHNCAIIVS